MVKYIESVHIPTTKDTRREPEFITIEVEVEVEEDADLERQGRRARGLAVYEVGEALSRLVARERAQLESRDYG